MKQSNDLYHQGFTGFVGVQKIVAPFPDTNSLQTNTFGSINSQPSSVYSLGGFIGCVSHYSQTVTVTDPMAGYELPSLYSLPKMKRNRPPVTTQPVLIKKDFNFSKHLGQKLFDVLQKRIELNVDEVGSENLSKIEIDLPLGTEAAEAFQKHLTSVFKTVLLNWVWKHAAKDKKTFKIAQSDEFLDAFATEIQRSLGISPYEIKEILAMLYIELMDFLDHVIIRQDSYTISRHMDRIYIGTEVKPHAKIDRSKEIWCRGKRISD